MLRKFYRYWLSKRGWSFQGNFEPRPDKYIIIIAPHTANEDFIIGIMARSVLGLRSTKFLGKSQLFKFPFGVIFRALGGYPVVRTKDNNLVDAVTEIFNKHQKFSIALAPEGTRSKVNRLKTGFYYIAKKANIPIYAVGFDYPTKTIIVADPFYPTDNFEKDIRLLFTFYSDIKGKNPELGFGSSTVDKTIECQGL